MTENFDYFEQKIIDTLNKFLKEVEENKYRGDSAWTSHIKEIIGDLGLSAEFNCQVAIGGFPNKYEPEWLYDIVWYEEDDRDRLKKLKLIAECEWKKDYREIKYDFEKILVGRAERRLFICQSKMEGIDSLFESFKSQINVFENNKGDRYLIAILDSNTERDFYFKTYTKD